MTAASTAPVLQTRGLRKSYGTKEAVKGVDLAVEPGEVFALLGPNGAGKTTVVEILEGYRARTGGEVEVLGVDPWRAPRRWRARIGLVLQDCRMEPELSVEETLRLFAGYYDGPLPVGEVMELVGLSDEAGTRVGRLSGGRQRRLDAGLALIGNPELLFLDEPTTGFDPAARRRFWRVIEDFSRLGKTVFLTTHSMEEAQALAHRVAVLVEGRIVAEGPPHEVGRREGAETMISFRLPVGVTVAQLPILPGSASRLENGRVLIATAKPLEALRVLMEWAFERACGLPEIQVLQPTLEEAYLRLTEGSGEDRSLGPEAER